MPVNRSLRAVASVRSYSRPATYGPRSMTRTRTVRVAAAERDLGAAGQRLVGDAEAARGQAAAAAERVAVEAGAVPRRVCRAVDVEPPDVPPGGAHAHAGGGAQRLPDAIAQDVAAGGAGAVAVERAPAALALDLQRGDDARGAGASRARDDDALTGADVQALLLHSRGGDRGGGLRRSGRNWQCETQRARRKGGAQHGSRSQGDLLGSRPVCLRGGLRRAIERADPSSPARWRILRRGSAWPNGRAE